MVTLALLLPVGPRVYAGGGRGNQFFADPELQAILQLASWSEAQALSRVNGTLSKDPGDLLARLSRSWLLLRLERPLEGISDATYFITREPDVAWAYYNRGHCNKMLGRGAEAVRDFETALRLLPPADPRRADYLFEIGRADDAVAFLKSQLEQAPSDGTRHYFLGKLYANSGRWADALTEFDAARKGRHAVAKLLLARVYLGVGDPEAAWKALTDPKGHMFKRDSDQIAVDKWICLKLLGKDEEADKLRRNFSPLTTVDDRWGLKIFQLYAGKLDPDVYEAEVRKKAEEVPFGPTATSGRYYLELYRYFKARGALRELQKGPFPTVPGAPPLPVPLDFPLSK